MRTADSENRLTEFFFNFENWGGSQNGKTFFKKKNQGSCQNTPPPQKPEPKDLKKQWEPPNIGLLLVPDAFPPKKSIFKKSGFNFGSRTKFKFWFQKWIWF